MNVSGSRCNLLDATRRLPRDCPALSAIKTSVEGALDNGSGAAVRSKSDLKRVNIAFRGTGNAIGDMFPVYACIITAIQLSIAPMRSIADTGQQKIGIVGMDGDGSAVTTIQRFATVHS